MLIGNRLKELRESSLFHEGEVGASDAVDETTAWSGSRFVPITEDGFPASDVQVSNLDTREDAAEYAASFRFEVVTPTIH